MAARTTERPGLNANVKDLNGRILIDAKYFVVHDLRGYVNNLATKSINPRRFR